VNFLTNLTGLNIFQLEIVVGKCLSEEFSQFKESVIPFHYLLLFFKLPNILLMRLSFLEKLPK